MPHLRSNGFAVEVYDSLDIYADAIQMSTVDLIVQCWTQGAISQAQLDGLDAAVRGGTGLAGWHGGIVDAFRDSPDYLQLTGGQFTSHPGGVVDYVVDVVDARRDHQIVAGFNRVALLTEQYWVLTDVGLSDVLATTTIRRRPDDPWHEPVTVPAIWTRPWGRGRVFVCTVGHALEDLAVPEIRTIIERGLVWASR
ncbi:MAG: ThuA domain-containing protein [Chloroflexi bacterium]|nr:ThuA domain-containing protein [Chloroflexota bacterium]